LYEDETSNTMPRAQPGAPASQGKCTAVLSSWSSPIKVKQYWGTSDC